MKYFERTGEKFARFEFGSEEEMEQMKKFILSMCNDDDCVIEKLRTKRIFTKKKRRINGVVREIKKLKKIVLELVERQNAPHNEVEVDNNMDYWKVNEPKNDDDCNKEYYNYRLRFSQDHAEKKVGEIVNHNFNAVKSLNEIKLAVKTIFNKQSNAYKFSISFGFILEFENVVDDVVTLTYKAYSPTFASQKFYKEAVYIGAECDLEKLDIIGEDIKAYCAHFFPNSKCRLIGIISAHMKIFSLQQLIGCAIDLPEYILKNRYVFSLKDSKNNMCFWDCVGIHKTKKRNGFMKASKSAFSEFYGKYETDYRGFDFIKELDRFEDMFGIGVNIYEYKGEDVKFVRRCLKEDVEIMNINLYLNHFSYICNIEKLCKKYVCENCGHNFQDNTDLKRHDALCKREKEDVFVKFPQVYEPKRNLIIELNEWFDCNCSFKYPYMIVFDFESLLLPINCALTEKLKLSKSHKVVSCSINSNIPHYTEPIHIENENVDVLFREMFTHFDAMSKEAGRLMKIQMGDLYKKVTNDRLIQSLDRYCNQCPVLGFNSGRYDINVNIEEFMN